MLIISTEIGCVWVYQICEGKTDLKKQTNNNYTWFSISHYYPFCFLRFLDTIRDFLFVCDYDDVRK